MLVRSLATAIFFSSLTFAQEKAISKTTEVVTPEMDRLAKALAGDWNNTETMERSEFFPQGGERRGVSHCALDTGGATLRCEGESDGSAGKLDHLIVIWWDEHARLYRFFTCFKDDKGAGCEVRGTAHWSGDVFMNDYIEKVKGLPTKMRDSFTDITENSHTLVEAVEAGNQKMKTLVTTRSTRH